MKTDPSKPGYESGAPNARWIIPLILFVAFATAFGVLFKVMLDASRD